MKSHAMCAVAIAMMIAAMTTWASDARGERFLPSEPFGPIQGNMPIWPRFVEGELPGVPDGRLRLELAKDTTLYLFARDGQLGEAIWVWRDGRPQNSFYQRWYLKGEGGRIRGFLASGDRDIRVDATVTAAGEVGGTWRIAGSDDEGPVTGGFETWEELAEGIEPATGAQWPQWAGPNHNFQLPATGVELVADFDEIRPLWRSEEASLAGIGTIARAITGATHRHHMAGGSASPVLADGRLYLTYFIPAGGIVGTDLPDGGLAGVDPDSGDREREERVARGWAERIGTKAVFEAGPRLRNNLRDWPHYQNWQQLPWGPLAAEYEKRRWYGAADQVVVCIDPRNGRTLWRKVFPGVAANAQDHKGAGNNLVPAVADGRLYVVTTGERILCLNAEDGSLLWEDQFGRNPGYIFGGRGHHESPLVIDGVVVYERLAWNARTGERLWRLSERVAITEGLLMTPWHDGERWLLLYFAGIDGGNPRQGREPRAAGLVAITVADGEIVWQTDLPGMHWVPLDPGPGILGDEVAFLVRDTRVAEDRPAGARRHGKYGGQNHMVYGRVTPEGFDLKWISPVLVGGRNHSARPIITGQAVITSENSWGVHGGRNPHGAGMLAFDKDSGELLRRLPGVAIGSGSVAKVIEDRLFVGGDNHHGHQDARIIPLDIRQWPERMERRFIQPPHYTTSPYSNPGYMSPYANGRLFIRGADGIYAYDLRKEQE
ncbi:MAG: PQQ-binding-like beta-propeller repeat protein [Phycisphaeraceae bacterium]|nr:PQQ-binding-like beta-propeller repeat protein [Phycisphaeraceae bacterium]